MSNMGYNLKDMSEIIGHARILKQCPYWYKVLPIVSFYYSEERNTECAEVVIRKFEKLNMEGVIEETLCTAKFYGHEFEVVEGL